MATYDVRNSADEVPTELRFANKDGNCYMADTMKKSSATNGASIWDSDSGRYLEIKNMEHANHLIKAIKKAEQLGWLK